MTVQNLATAPFALEFLLQELEEFDRCIPVALNIQVGDVADALTVFMTDRQILRLTVPNARSAARRPRPAQAVRPAASKRKSRVSRLG